MNPPTNSTTEKAPRVFVPEAAMSNMVANLPNIEIRAALIPGTRKTVIQVVKNGYEVLIEAPNNSLLIQSMAEKLWGAR